MTWNLLPKSEPLTYESAWKKPKEIMHKTGLKCLFWGDPETGKTHAALTFPPPIYVIDTEFGVYPLLNHPEFENKDIRIFEAATLDVESADVDPIKSFERIEEAITLLKDASAGTVVIDTATDVWQWLVAWTEATATMRTQRGQPYRLEYGPTNRKYRKLLLRLMCKPVHVVLTAQPTELYDRSGQALGIYVPRVQRQTGHVLDLAFHLIKDYDAERKTVKYTATLTKCRFQRGFNTEIENITYPKIIEMLRTKLGVVVAFEGPKEIKTPTIAEFERVGEVQKS